MRTEDRAFLGLGTAPFVPGYGLGTSTSSGDDLPSLVQMTVERGIRYIDTAAAYGETEVVLGRLAEWLMAHRVRICTKVSVNDNGSKALSLQRRLATSLRRLRVPYVDTALLHSATSDDLSDPHVAEALGEAKREGYVQWVGASTYGLADGLAAITRPWCDVVQVEYSILNQSVVRAIASHKRKGQALIARSVLCKGLLTDRRRHAPELERQVEAAVEELERFAGDWGYPLPELAIRFALDTPGIDVVLVGISNDRELESALRAYQREPLSPDQWRRLSNLDCSELSGVHPERWATVSGHVA